MGLKESDVSKPGPWWDESLIHHKEDESPLATTFLSLLSQHPILYRTCTCPSILMQNLQLVLSIFPPLFFRVQKMPHICIRSIIHSA